jgi:hypothetical protein
MRAPPFWSTECYGLVEVSAIADLDILRGWEAPKAGTARPGGGG